MQVAPGTLLGPYEVLALIGAGGMGQVYRARDTRLERQVAIKVITASAAGDAAAMERFQREARAIATLNHPHICTIHDVGREQDVQFLVMEYLEGETLAAALARRKSRTKRSSGPASPQPARASGPSPGSGADTVPASPFPYSEVLTIGAQLADALAAAHRAGIVHRDLKPANVMLTPTGVKVLDFGLAKLSDPAHALVASTSEPAETMTGTDPGLLVGTLPYMAPEQVENRAVDARTDIFALGGILYELTVGRRAFTGESPASLIAAILEHDPDPVSAAQAVPPGFDRLVRKCLAKDPAARWQSASDVADELRWLASAEGSGPIAGVPPPPRRSRTRVWGVAVGVALLLAMGSLGVWLWSRGRETSVAPLAARHTQVTFTGDVRAAALSPDGRTVAFATGPHDGPIRVMARDLAGGQAIELWRGNDVFKLQWRPDLSSLLAVGLNGSNKNGIWVVPRLGGVAQQLPEYNYGFAQSPDGSRIALSGHGDLGFNVITADGRVIRRVQLKGTQQFIAIEWGPGADQVVLLTSNVDDGKSVVITATSEGRDQRQVYDDPLPITALCSSPIADALYLLRYRDDTHELLRLRVTGSNGSPPQVLLTGLPVFIVGTTASQPCSVSADGDRLLYMRGSSRSSLWRLDLRRSGTPATLLTPGTSALFAPALSPDGQSLVAVQRGQQEGQIVKLSGDGAEIARLGAGFSPSWSPDGQRIVFISNRSGSRRAWVADSDGQHAAEIKDSTPDYDVTWLRDGRIAWSLTGSLNYRLHDLSSSQGELLRKDPPDKSWVFTPRFSPRGDQVAVFMGLGGPDKRGLWLISWPSRVERFLAPELRPMAWSADGEWIYACGRDHFIFRVSARTGKTELLGTFPTGSLESQLCTVAADLSVVVCPITESSYDAWVVEHFDPEVRVPVQR